MYALCLCVLKNMAKKQVAVDAQLWVVFIGIMAFSQVLNRPQNQGSLVASGETVSGHHYQSSSQRFLCKGYKQLEQLAISSSCQLTPIHSTSSKIA